MNPGEFPEGGELDSLHLSFIEKKYEYDGFHQSEIESPNLDPLSPLHEQTDESPVKDNLEDCKATTEFIMKQGDVTAIEQKAIYSSPNHPNHDSAQDYLVESNLPLPFIPGDLQKGSLHFDNEDPTNVDNVKDIGNSSNPNPNLSNENRRSSIELRLQKAVESVKSSKITSVKSLQSNVTNNIPSPMISVYDMDIESMSHHRDLLPLLPMETNLIYGQSQDASILLNDMNAEETKPLNSTIFSDAPSKESTGTPASASSWLSKSSSILEEPKYQLVFPNRDTPAELANNKRNADFHELFPSLDQKDRLVDGLFFVRFHFLDFTCAWLTDMLMHGRVYITQNNVCFYAKVIWTYMCIIPISDIISVEKKALGRVFDNALEIRTRDKNVSMIFFNFISSITSLLFYLETKHMILSLKLLMDTRIAQ